MRPRFIVSLSRIVLLVLLLSYPFRSSIANADQPATDGNSESQARELLKTQVRTLVEDAIEQGNLPGAVIRIGTSDVDILDEAYGNRQVEPHKAAMTRDTVFDLASLTKPIATATSVMLLVQRGQVSLHDPVAKHIPLFGAKEKDAVTVQQLLLHTGGLIPDNAMSDYEDTPEQSIANFLSVPLNYQPGTRFRYSDVGFEVLGELVRACSQADLHSFSQANIFKPLGMNETAFRPIAELAPRMAPTEKRGGIWKPGEVHDPRAFALGGVAGHAGLFSTSSDLAIFARMMLGDGMYAGTRILEAKTVELIRSPYQVPGGVRGLGWDKQTGYSSNRGRTMSASAIGHGGFTGTAMWIDSELDLFVIFLSNRVHPDGRGSVNALAGEIGTLAADYRLQIAAKRIQ